MREKILSLAKGNFIYETPKLCLSIETVSYTHLTLPTKA